MGRKMDRERIIQIGPVCRFGPGGDYTSTWPEGSELIEFVNTLAEPKNAIGRLLDIIAGMAQILRGSRDKQGIEIIGPVEIPIYGAENRRAAYTEAGPVV